MKKHIIFLAALVLLMFFAPTARVYSQVEKDNDVICIGDPPQAEFPLPEGLDVFINNNIQYPKEAKEKGIEGVVAISFTIDKDGTPIDFKVMRDIGGGCAEEALRVLKLMPKWKPAEDGHGNTIRTKYGKNIRFRLDETKEKEN